MRVPIVGPQIDPQPLRIPEQQVPAGPAAFGAGIAEGIGAAGGTAFDVALDQKRRTDAAAVVDISGTAINAANSVLSDPETGILNKQMKGAIDAAPDAHARLVKVWSDAEAAATNPTQKAVIREMGVRQTASDSETIQRHVAAESEKYHDWSAGQLVEASVNRAALTPIDEGVAADAIAHAQAAVDLRLKGKVEPDQLSQAKDEAASVVQASRLEALDSQGNHAAFLKVYDSVKDQLTPVAAAKFAKVAAATTDLVEAFKNTDAIYSKFKDDPEAGYNAAANIEDPNVRKAVQTELHTRYAEHRDGVLEADRTDVKAVQSIFAKTGSLSSVPRDLYDRVATNTPEAIITLQNEATRRAHERMWPDTNDVDAWGKWMDLPDDQKILPGNDPTTSLIGKVTPGTMDYAIRLHAEILARNRGVDLTGKPIEAVQPKSTPLTSRDETFKGIARDAGLLPPTGTFKDTTSGRVGQARFNSFRLAAQEAVDDYTSKILGGKREMTNDEIQKVVAPLAVKGAFGSAPSSGLTQRILALNPSLSLILGGGGGPPSYAFENLTGPAPTTDVPAADRIQIMNALRDRGLPITEESIRRLYFKAQSVTP